MGEGCQGQGTQEWNSTVGTTGCSVFCDAKFTRGRARAKAFLRVSEGEARQDNSLGWASLDHFGGWSLIAWYLAPG